MKIEKRCTLCGFEGKSKTLTKGSFWLEIVLWLMFIWPGIIYSIWRLTTRQEVCGNCGNEGTLIPTVKKVEVKAE